MHSKKNKGTEDLLKEVSAYINGQIYNECYVLALFIDLSKAFDTINHSIMIAVLKDLGVTGKYLKWFESYLSDRQFKVKIKNGYSDNKNCEYGVPQGSNLGPILFIMYMNNIFKVVKYVKIWAYADDILIIASHKDLDIAKRLLQHDFNKINKWMHDMDLIINSEKTVMMNIHLRNKKSTINPSIKYHTCKCKMLEITTINNLEHSSEIDMPTVCDCKQIKIVKSCDYLGITIDDGLTWKGHTDKVMKKLCSSTAALFRLRNVITVDGKTMIYKALVESIIRYGIIMYGNAAHSHLNKICKLQRKSLGLLFKRDEAAINKDIFLRANTLSPTGFYKLSIFMNYFGNNEYKILNNKSTNIMLRNVEKLKVFKIRNTFGKSLPAYIVPALYNKLPEDIFYETNRKKFKKLVLSYLMTLNFLV